VAVEGKVNSQTIYLSNFFLYSFSKGVIENKGKNDAQKTKVLKH
jgi:hypothetical protein